VNLGTPQSIAPSSSQTAICSPAIAKVLVDDIYIRSYTVGANGTLTAGAYKGMTDETGSMTNINSATSDSKGNWLVRSVSRTEQSSNVRTKDFKLLTFVFFSRLS